MRPSNHQKEMIPNPLADIGTDLISGTLSDFAPVDIEMISGSNRELLWNQLVNKYHYLGFQRLLGHGLKYFAFIQDRPVAALSWSAPALKLGQRDCFIGWSTDQRKRHLHQVVGNSRFLIMPWVQIPNLASHVMGLNISRLTKDWKRHFDTQLLLLESFVDSRFFKGTCYKAANWKYLGPTIWKYETRKRIPISRSSKTGLSVCIRPRFQTNYRLPTKTGSCLQPPSTNSNQSGGAYHAS